MLIKYTIKYRATVRDIDRPTKEMTLKANTSRRNSSIEEIPANNDLNETIARALQLQFDLEDEALESARDSHNNNTRSTIVVSGGRVEHCSTEDDVEFAKKLDQELRDEELALRLQEEETQPSLSSSDSAMTNDVANPSVQNRNRASSRRQCTYKALSYIVTIPLLIAAVFAVLYMFLGPGAGNSPIFPGFPIFPDVLMHGSGNNGTLVPWPSNRGHGLDMTLINALTEQWHPYFDLAVTNWDNGTPDSLTLTSIVSRPDPDCSPMQGMIKVCNGNYGNTEWKGINEIMVKNNLIISSVAKINDYYSKVYSDGESRYLLCHEIGHGFGLPHADENFNNRDLGTCMDYTMRPESNQLPNRQDYELLLQMYGPVEIKRPSNLRSLSSIKLSSAFNHSPQHHHISFLNTHHTHPWNLVDNTEHIQVYELDIGQGVKMRSQLLLR